MSDIVLVHGSVHGAWCWRDVIPLLEDMGHTVRAIDMPSHGSDPTPLSQVTLENCAASVVDALGTDTVVVGHSWGGYPITRAADIAPERIQRLVHLCTYVPMDGLSLVDMRKLATRQPLMQAVIRSNDGLSYHIDPRQTAEVFYHDCPEGTVAYANPRLCQQAIAPQVTPITLGDGSASVPKSYIRTLDDRTIPPEFQITMTNGWPSKDVYEMPCGHSPFFADPAGLVKLINHICQE